MAVIAPTGKVKEAAAFITEKRELNPKAPLSSLIDEAGMRFNLTPIDTEALTRIFTQTKEQD